MKHAFALRVNLGDPGTRQRPQANVSAVLKVQRSFLHEQKHSM